jgi:acyl-CoA thioester hydrolase
MLTFSLQPRFSETDALGHINNTAIPAWLEEARVEVFRMFNPSLAFESWNLILKRYEVEFLRQLTRAPGVEVRTWVEAVGTTSLILRQDVVQGGSVAVESRTVLIHFDYSTQRPSPIPDEIRSRLLEHTAKEPEAS